MSQALTVSIRHFRKSDLDAVVAIESDLYARPWSKDSFKQFLNDPAYRLFVALVGNRVVGYCIAQVTPPESELHNIAVAKVYQGRKVALQLLNSFFKRVTAEGVREVFLMVREESKKAMALYEGLGFRLLNRRKNYYNDPREDALIYYKNLDTGRQ